MPKKTRKTGGGKYGKAAKRRFPAPAQAGQQRETSTPLSKPTALPKAQTTTAKPVGNPYVLTEIKRAALIGGILLVVIIVLSFVWR
jgi:hypothetical protein